MKATLEFNLPEDQEEFRLANEGATWGSLVWELDDSLRDAIKHETKFMGAQADYGTLQLVREQIAFLMEESLLDFPL